MNDALELHESLAVIAFTSFYITRGRVDGVRSNQRPIPNKE
jgi:hypothetical protein